MKRSLSLLIVLALMRGGASAGEQPIVNLRDFTETELKSAGIELTQTTTVHIRALGAGSSGAWSSKGGDLYAYGWIINADTREPVWTMTLRNTSRKGNDRQFDGTVTLGPGAYEVYFTAYAFASNSAFSGFSSNIDHRRTPLFDDPSDNRNGFMTWFKGFFSGGSVKEFRRRAPAWGMDLLVDNSMTSTVRSFAPPRLRPNVVASAIGVGDNACVRIAFELGEQTTLSIYAQGEHGTENELTDCAWIVNLAGRHRVWEMNTSALRPAGGAEKNVKFDGDITLPRGQYLLYYISDDSHSMADWNLAPPADPLMYGITLAINEGRARARFRQFPYDDYANTIVSLVQVGNEEHRSEGFALKTDADVRVLAFGERDNSRRSLADYGMIIDARTRKKVWTMDVDRTMYAGGASKNRYIDEVIHLPRGNYEVSYTSDDSHAYDDWNTNPPFDPSHYGITVMGAGPGFSTAVLGTFKEERDRNVIAQIVRVRDNADRTETFTLNRATRVRIYAIGEGVGHEMADYGWIENSHSGNVVWEMTYGMTFHAGGGRKNRMVNTTVLLDKGEYRLRYRTDDSHAYGEWNVDPPEDQEYYGITLYRDEGGAIVPTPAPSMPDDEDIPPAPPAPAPMPAPKHRR